MYTYRFNPLSNRFDIVQDTTLLTLKGVVATTADLPLTGNSINILYVVSADDRLYTWNKAESSGILSDWVDIGSVTSIAWSAIADKPSSSVVDIDSAVSLKHTQNTDQYLDFGGGNQVAVADAKDAVDKAHTQDTDTILQKTGGLSLDQSQELSDGTYSITSNPYAQVFKAEQSGELRNVYLDITQTDFVGNITIKIVALVGGEPSGSVLATQVITEASLVVGWTNIIFSSPVSVVSGTSYAITMEASGTGTAHYNFKYSESPLYAYGTLWYYQTGTWTVSPNEYFKFRTYVYDAVGVADLINDGTLNQNLLVDNGFTIDGRDLSIDGTKLDTIEVSAVALTTVKADSDIASAISLKHSNTSDHTQNSDTDLDATFEATFVKKLDTINVLSDITSAGADIEDAVTKKHVAVTVVAAPLTLSTQAITFNYDSSDFALDGNNLSIKADGIKDTHIDWGTNANQVNSDDIPDHNGHSVLDTFNHIINRGKTSPITISLTGGLGVSWTTGEIYDAANTLYVTTDLGSGNVTDNSLNYLKWVSGTSLTLSTSTTSGDEILIAIFTVYDGIIDGYRETSLINESVANTRRALRASFPSRVISGMSIYEDTDVTNALDVTMDAGVYWCCGIEEFTPVEIKSRNTSMVRHFHTAGVWNYDTNAEIDTLNYDNGTNLTAITAGKYVKALFFYMNGKIGWTYPTEFFNTLAQAQNAALPTMPSGLELRPKLTAIVYQQGDTNFTSAIWQDVRPGISEETFNAVTDHGALTGLSDDDHTQYILVDGTRAFTGNVDIGANTLTVNSIEIVGADGEVNKAAVEDSGNWDSAYTASHTVNQDTELDSGVVDVDGSDNVTINQNSIAAFTSINASAVVNTLYLKEGYVGICTNAPTAHLHLKTTVGSVRQAIETSAASDAELEFINTNGGDVTWAMGLDYSDSKNFAIAYAAADGASLTTHKVFSINTDGVVDLKKGQIKFPATQNASADVNTLDDYEEGTWTPSKFGFTEAGGGSYTLTGTYTKIGRKVFIKGTVVCSGGATIESVGGSTSYITGLPFTALTTPGGYVIGVMNNYVMESYGNGLITSNSATIYFDTFGPTTANHGFTFSGSYEV